MSKSLADQLLKAGLVNKKQVSKAKQEKHQNKPKQQGKKKQAAASDPGKVKMQQAQAEKVERDRQLNREREKETQRRALAAQARQLIENNRRPKDDCKEEDEQLYHFEDRNKIKRLRVAKETHAHITEGKLAIVKLGNKYELVSRTVAENISERDASYVILLNKPETENQTDAEDPYADYQVPDDLMW